MKNTNESPCLLPTATLTGDPVCDCSGEQVGTIKELMLDTKSGRIMYAVMSVGGFLGVGNKLFAVPWTALRSEPGSERRFTINMAKERLQMSPRFDRGHWPDMSNPTFHRQAHRFYCVPQDDRGTLDAVSR